MCTNNLSLFTDFVLLYQFTCYICLINFMDVRMLPNILSLLTYFVLLCLRTCVNLLVEYSGEQRKSVSFRWYWSINARVADQMDE